MRVAWHPLSGMCLRHYLEASGILYWQCGSHSNLTVRSLKKKLSEVHHNYRFLIYKINTIWWNFKNILKSIKQRKENHLKSHHPSGSHSLFPFFLCVSFFLSFSLHFSVCTCVFLFSKLVIVLPVRFLIKLLSPSLCHYIVSVFLCHCIL